MKRFHFWQQWLFYSSIVFALFGIVFAIYGNNVLFRTYNDDLARIFWHQRHLPPSADSFRAFIWAPLGGTIACCYVLLAWIAYFPFRKKEKWSWIAIATAFGVWIIIDSLSCIYYGVYFQVAAVNVFSFLVKALPLAFTYHEFFGRKK